MQEGFSVQKPTDSNPWALLAVDNHYRPQTLLQESQRCCHALEVLKLLAQGAGFGRPRRLSRRQGPAVDAAAHLLAIGRQDIMPAFGAEEMRLMQPIAFHMDAAGELSHLFL